MNTADTVESRTCAADTVTSLIRCAAELMSATEKRVSSKQHAKQALAGTNGSFWMEEFGLGAVVVSL